MARVLDLDELIEHWTVLKPEWVLVAGKRGATRLGFAVILKFYTRFGRFPRGRGELATEAVEFVARQVDVPAAELGSYSWSGRTWEYHRAQIRAHLGFRECTVADADKLAAWLAEDVCATDPRPATVREALLGRCRTEHIEPPTAGRRDRIVRSARAQAERAATDRIAARLAPETKRRLSALISDVADDEAATGVGVLGSITAAAGNVSLETMLVEIDKLRAVRAVGLPPALFAGTAPVVLAGWRARAAVEDPSHLRSHPESLRLTLLAALLVARERELTDTLVDLLIATVHRIGARTERKVTEELVNAFKRVTGKENILFSVAGAALARPDEAVREVVFPRGLGWRSDAARAGARVQDQRPDLPAHRQDHPAHLLHQPLPAAA